MVDAVVSVRRVERSEKRILLGFESSAQDRMEVCTGRGSIDAIHMKESSLVRWRDLSRSNSSSCS